MQRIAVADVEHPPTVSPAAVLRPLAPALGAEGVALNYFELAPGERFGFDFHCHRDQEELFYVLSGTATFESAPAPGAERESVAVGPHEAVRFAPGEFQLGRNAGDERVVALAVGAPRESRSIEYYRDCPTCDERTVQRPEWSDERGPVPIRCGSCETVVDEGRR